jgi:hypothetical protein
MFDWLWKRREAAQQRLPEPRREAAQQRLPELLGRQVMASGFKWQWGDRARVCRERPVTDSWHPAKDAILGQVVVVREIVSSRLCSLTVECVDGDNTRWHMRPEWLTYLPALEAPAPNCGLPDPGPPEHATADATATPMVSVAPVRLTVQIEDLRAALASLEARHLALNDHVGSLLEAAKDAGKTIAALHERVLELERQQQFHPGCDALAARLAVVEARI